MNLDKLEAALCREALSADEIAVLDNLLKNQGMITAPSGVPQRELIIVLSMVPIMFAIDWAAARARLQDYEAALPHLKTVGCVDSVPAPYNYGQLKIIGHQKSSGDRPRVLKGMIHSMFNRPYHQLVADVLNAAFDCSNAEWTVSRVNRL